MKKNNELEIPMNIGMRGEYELEVVDTLTGLTKYTKSNKNMILDNAFRQIINSLNANFNYGCLASGNISGLFNNSADVACHIGTGGGETLSTMTQLENRVTSRTTTATGSLNSFLEKPYYARRRFIFGAGAFVNTLREIGIGNNNTSGAYLHTRITIEPELEVLATDELRVTWTIFYELPENNTWSGTIVNGQRTGGDINWALTISDVQVPTFFQNRLGNGNNDSGPFGNWGTSGPAFRFGANNAPTESTDWNIKGSSLFSGSISNAFKEHEVVDEYPFSRAIEVGFEHNNPNNVQIAEMVVFGRTTYNAANSFFRITFDPVLDKAEFFRLFLKYRLTLSRV